MSRPVGRRRIGHRDVEARRRQHLRKVRVREHVLREHVLSVLEGGIGVEKRLLAPAIVDGDVFLGRGGEH